MEQLRGEALKFHKPGRTEPPDQLEDIMCENSCPITKPILRIHLLLSTMQERTTQLRAM